MSKLIRQIFAYGIIGALATAINFAVAVLLTAYVWPCLTETDIAVKYFGFNSIVVDDAVRAYRAVMCNLVGFLMANVICWILNRKYVFTPGRHGLVVEYLLFLSGSGLAILIGNAIIYFLILLTGAETSYAIIVNVLVSVALNFVVRKFIVFKE